MNRNRTMHRALSVVLSICMLVTNLQMMVIPAFAADEPAVPYDSSKYNKMWGLATPEMAEKLPIDLVTQNNFVEFGEIVEGELIKLPESVASQLAIGDSRIVTAELMSVETIPLEGTNEEESIAVDARVVTWDWWAYELILESHNYNDLLPLNSEVTFLVRFANMGTASTPATTAALRLSDKQFGGTGFISGTFNVAPLEPYSLNHISHLYRLTVELANPPGAHTFEITVNPHNQPENNEYPNTVEEIFTWGDSTTIIDPACFDIRAIDNPETDTLPIGVQTPIEFFVANNGNAAAPKVPVMIGFYDDITGYSAFGSFATSAIPAGYARRLTSSVKFISQGAKQISMGLDQYNEIVDHNRNNNFMEKDFSIIGAPPAGMLYGLLGFEYPLPLEWTGYYPRTNHPGNGLDINAPQGTPINSVGHGTVSLSGTSLDKQRGYFVVVTHSTLDPYNGKPLISRYLHMWKAPDVVKDEEVDWYTKLGEVGKTGAFVGSGAVNHLHLDFNSSGIFASSVPTAQGINPQLFYPYVNFHVDTLPRSTSSNDCDSDFSIDKMYQEGTFVDTALIKYIGEELFEEWQNNNSGPGDTVYKLICDFNISWETLQEVLQSSVYEQYTNHRPV